MTMTALRYVPVLMVCTTLLLAGCESAEEKADRYFQSGLALIEAGDIDRALVEFRNVFQYDGFHQQARQTYADIQLARGDEREAYSQYLRLIEQYPDTLPVRLTLTRLAMGRGDWEEVERHGQAAIALAPQDPEVEAVAASLAYRAAVQARDDAAAAAAVDRIVAVLAVLPDNIVARRALIDSLVSGPTPADALPEIDRALALEPDVLALHVQKLRLLATLPDDEAVGVQLREMFARFPDNDDVRSALTGWYLSQQDYDAAEALLRTLAGDVTGPVDGHVALVQFIRSARGPDGAVAELDRLAAANDGQPAADLYRALRAGLQFETAPADEAADAEVQRQTAAMAEVETILRNAEPTDQTRQIRIMLAQMLLATGNEVGARAEVETVLAEDAGNVAALKLRAAWLIDEDRPGAAITDLRAALDQAPRDSSILTLMALAHDRDGSPELAGERLALAVEVSGVAPAESLRYAQFLLQQGRGSVAEAVLVEAVRVSPGDLGLLAQLAEVRLGNSDWPRVNEVLLMLQRIDTPEAGELAGRVRAASLLGQQRTAETIALLEQQITGADRDSGTVALLALTQIRAGNPEAARATIDAALADAPDNPDLLFQSANLHGMMGEIAAAEAQYRALIDRLPQSEQPVRRLYGLLLSQEGRQADADAVLEAGLAAMPGSVGLGLIRAGRLEQAGDIDGAIAVYEALYAADSGNVIVANNLASLLSAHRGDAATLERAAAISRRLRNANVPAFQDTYGWIEYRRGNYDEALRNLEPAAAGLPDDPLVQYHLGMTYAALGRADDAKVALERAISLAGDDPLPQLQPQLQTARDILAGVHAAPAGAESPELPMEIPANAGTDAGTVAGTDGELAQ
jgi:cellulose synthase operon protein C